MEERIKKLETENTGLKKLVKGLEKENADLKEVSRKYDENISLIEESIEGMKKSNKNLSEDNELLNLEIEDLKANPIAESSSEDGKECFGKYKETFKEDGKKCRVCKLAKDCKEA